MPDQPLDPTSVLPELTLEEKAALVSGADFWHTVAVDRLGVPAIMCADGPHGMRAQMESADHMGISGSVPATCFPTASAIASSWDPELVAEVGRALGVEAAASKVAVVLGPGLNIKRSPLCGRNFEYFSEDPFLSGRLAVGMVRGIQSTGVGTSVKHYAANNQEDDRLRVSAEIDDRTLREIYLSAFETVITEADPWTVMCAYNRINGVHASQHHWLLTEVLREEWRYQGVVVSDWGAVHDRVAALQAGLDWEMPPDLPTSPDAVVAAVRDGDLEESVLDTSVERMLRLVARSEAGPAGADAAESTFDVDAHHRLARRAAAESIVLLRNDGDLLPLSAGLSAGVSEGTVALVGEFARTPRFQGAGSSQVNPTRVDNVLEELRSALGEDRVSFAPGYHLPGSPVSAGVSAEDLREEATSVAAAADVVVLMIGLPSSAESEGFDRTHLRIPDDQLALLDAVRAANPTVVVVLVNGSTVEVAPWVEDVPVVLEAWLGGQAAGGAIADVLTGVAEPSGRLAETVPVRLEDNAAFLNFPGDSGVVRYGEGVFVGYRGHDRQNQPVSFPFGFGLGYTTFSMDQLEVSTAGTVEGSDLRVTVRVQVTNTGSRMGAEVVQVYVADPACSVARPPRELRGFAKVRLEPGASKTIGIELTQRAFAYWSVLHDGWVVEAGEFEIQVGSHSRDLPLRHTITVDAPSLAAPLSGWSTLQEWFEDPLGRQLLQQQSGDGSPLADEELVRVIGTMPLSTLAGFPATPFGHDDVAALTAAWQERAG